MILRDGKNTQKNYTKSLNDLANHNGVATHLDPEILECEVKWVLGSITINRAGRGDLIVRFYEIGKSCSLSQKIEKDEHIKVISY